MNAGIPAFQKGLYVVVLLFRLYLLDESRCRSWSINSKGRGFSEEKMREVIDLMSAV